MQGARAWSRFRHRCRCVALDSWPRHLRQVSRTPPLHRVQQELGRSGVNVSRATLCGWVEAAGVALQPLWLGIQAGLMAGDYLQVDETPVRVLDPEIQVKA